MNSKQLLFAIVLSLLFFPVTNTMAQSSKVKSFQMSVKGTSSLHEWESQVEKLECKAIYKVEGNRLLDLKDVLIKIPVRSIKSTKGRMMDNKTYDAFHADKHPTITFLLTGEKINPSTFTVDLKGNLSMAGATMSIDFPVKYLVLPNGDLQVSGSKKIIMTEYKMEPPTAMMGTIEVGDEVVIQFEIVLTNATTNL